MTISLEKRAEKIGIILDKAGIKKESIPPIRVGLALDISGSIEKLYNNGSIQETVDRLLAVSLKFDDNGELDMWSFCDRFNRLVTATPNDYGTYVKKQIMENSSISKWGGTAYGPVLEDMMNFWFPTQSSHGHSETKKSWWPFGKEERPLTETAPTIISALESLPAMGLLVTDGVNSDKSHTEEILKLSKNKNVYWQMVGIGNPDEFVFLEKMADDLPNVGFVNLASLSITDDELYAELIAEEFIGWIKKISTP